ncbi:MAG: HAD-IIIA family hydrolase [Bacteroidia bacterium]
MILDQLHPDKTWTLFLDRDGVINTTPPNAYVLSWKEFSFNDGVFAAISRLSEVFGKIIVITNQQGVGKGLMSEKELWQIHINMKEEIEKNDGRIDAIYAATELATKDVEGMRKPNPGMALKAKRDFPEIDFSKSVVVGDAITDMQFGKAAGMFTVFVTHNIDEEHQHDEVIDFKIKSLADLV